MRKEINVVLGPNQLVTRVSPCAFERKELLAKETQVVPVKEKDRFAKETQAGL